MRKLHFTNSFLACAIVALGFTPTAHAAANRTFVSTLGNDSNTSVNCSASAHCRTFSAALSVTNPGGEIVVVDSGGYGPVTINQAVTISAIGIVASISQPSSGENAITISTTGNVTLIGLGLHGLAGGNDGILVSQVGVLRVFSLLIENFKNDGIEFASTGTLAMYDSNLNGNAANGLEVSAAGSVFVHNTGFDGNKTAGVLASNGNVTLADSFAHGNTSGVDGTGGTIALFGDHLVLNTTAGISISSGSITLANCLVTQNAKPYVISGGSLSGSNPATSLLTGTGTGTPAAATALF